MLKKIIKIFIPTIALIPQISSCGFDKSILSHNSYSNSTIDQTTSITYSSTSLSPHHEYSEINHLKIYWSQIFLMDAHSYFVYLYSVTCSHCASIKDYMIDFALSNAHPIYFIESSTEVVINESYAQNLNIDSIVELGIRGYPTLLVIEEKLLINNVAGINPIKNIVNNYIK